MSLVQERSARSVRTSRIGSLFPSGFFTSSMKGVERARDGYDFRCTICGISVVPKLGCFRCGKWNKWVEVPDGCLFIVHEKPSQSITQSITLGV